MNSKQNTDDFITNQLSSLKQTGKIQEKDQDDLAFILKKQNVKNFIRAPKHNSIVNNLFKFITNTKRAQAVYSILSTINSDLNYESSQLIDFCAPIFCALFDPERNIPDGQLDNLSGIVTLLMVDDEDLKTLKKVTAVKIIEGLNKNIPTTYSGISDSIVSKEDTLTDFLDAADPFVYKTPHKKKDNSVSKDEETNSKDKNDENDNNKTPGEEPDDDPKKDKGCCKSICLLM